MESCRVHHALPTSSSSSITSTTGGSDTQREKRSSLTSPTPIREDSLSTLARRHVSPTGAAGRVMRRRNQSTAAGISSAEAHRPQPRQGTTRWCQRLWVAGPQHRAGQLVVNEDRDDQICLVRPMRPDHAPGRGRAVRSARPLSSRYFFARCSRIRSACSSWRRRCSSRP
jgi:hypothetical protein